MLTDEWYPTLTQPNVDVVTDRIEEITPGGIRAGGRERPYDVIVLATGFKTHGFVAPMAIAGEDGRTLDEAWAGHPKAYLGMSVPGFPNMFLLYGPNTNGGSGLGHLHDRGGRRARDRGARGDGPRGRAADRGERAAAEAFDRELREALRGTVWHSGCTNWYVDEHGNDPNQWPWLWSQYKRRTASIEPGAYVVG